MAFNTAPGYGNLPNGNFSPVLFSKKVLKRFRQVAVSQAITNTEYQGELTDLGQSVRIIREPTITVRPYTRGTVVSPQDLMDEQTELTVDQANYFAFKVDDIEAKQSHLNWMSLAADRAAFEIMNEYDKSVLTEMVAGAVAPRIIGSIGTPQVVRNNPATGELSALNIMARMERLLNQANVPMQGRFLVADPVFWEIAAQEESRLMQANITGMAKSPMLDGLFNGKVINTKIRNFDCYLSNNLPTGGTGSEGSGANNYGVILAGHVAATATATQIAKTETLRDPTGFADICRGMQIFGRKVLRNEALVVSYWNAGA